MAKKTVYITLKDGTRFKTNGPYEQGNGILKANKLSIAKKKVLFFWVPIGGFLFEEKDILSAHGVYNND